VRPGREPALWPVAVTAALLLALSFFVLQQWLEQSSITDVPVYEGYAQLIRAGALPYRDFAVEYPPAALPAFLLPSYLPWSFATSFAVAMGLCGAGCIAVAAGPLRAVAAGPVRATAALLLIGISPLVLGSLFDTRFDLWSALLAVAALAAVLRERPIAAGVLCGLAFSAKLWPVALGPVWLAYLWRRRGPRAAGAAIVAFAVAAAVCFVPFAVLAPGGIRHSLTGQLSRPLQVESLGAAILTAAHQIGGLSLTTVTAHGSQDLSGRLPDAVAALSAGLQGAAIVAISLAFARRRRPTGDDVLVFSAAVVATLVALGKVFSPQFLIWLVPFVPLVRGRRGATSSLLLLAALGLTQTWFPDGYWRLAIGHASPWSWYLLARDLVVLALAGVLTWPRRREPGLLEPQRARLDALRAIRPRFD
jgi:Glycosyltransferase family 87